MEKKPKVTFKKRPKAKGYFYMSTAIKMNGHECGTIDHPLWGKEGWRVAIMVVKQNINEDGNPNCKWNWIFYGDQSCEEDARELAKVAIERLIREGQTIHFFED